MVWKHKQPHVLTAGLVSVRNGTWIIREYQAHDRFYSRALITYQEITHEYYVHDRIY